MANVDLVGLDSSTEPSDSLAELGRLAPSLLGRGSLARAQERLARGMLEEALRRTAANYTRTAQQLGVRRQAIQQMVTRFGLETWVARLRRDA